MHVSYVILCTYSVVCMLDIRCYVHIVFCTCFMCGVVYI